MSPASCPAPARPTKRSSTPRTTTISASAPPDANGDRIFNGAIDNATGIAHLIEQARAFARGPRTQRSVVFLAVGAEEKGLLGSELLRRQPACSRSARPWPCSTPIRWASAARRAISAFRQRQARPARPADRRRQASRAAASARKPTRRRRLLPLRPFRLRQGRRSGGQLRAGQSTWSTAGPRAARRWRPTMRPSAITSRTTNSARLGLQRHRPGRAIAPRGRLRPRQWPRLAQLEQRQRIPRSPRPVGRRAPGRARRTGLDNFSRNGLIRRNWKREANGEEQHRPAAD